MAYFTKRIKRKDYAKVAKETLDLTIKVSEAIADKLRVIEPYIATAEKDNPIRVAYEHQFWIVGAQKAHYYAQLRYTRAVLLEMELVALSGDLKDLAWYKGVLDTIADMIVSEKNKKKAENITNGEF